MNYYRNVIVSYSYSHGKYLDHTEETTIKESPTAAAEVMGIMTDLIETWEGEWTVTHTENHGKEWSEHTFVATLNRPDEKNGPTTIQFLGYYGY